MTMCHLLFIFSTQQEELTWLNRYTLYNARTSAPAKSRGACSWNMVIKKWMVKEDRLVIKGSSLVVDVLFLIGEKETIPISIMITNNPIVITMRSTH